MAKRHAWETGYTVAGRFAARLRQVADKRGLDLDGIVRLSVRLKHATVTRWWFGTRMPRATSLVDLARALEMDPLDLVRGVELDKAMLQEIKSIAEAEGTRKKRTKAA